MALPLVDLADILRGAGCEVVEVDGWRTRGHPGVFTPRATMLHHDGSPVGPAQPAEVYARFLFLTGRRDVSAPLCQAWIDFYGRWWLGAAGRANHAGRGIGWGDVRANYGNTLSFGVEMDNTTGEPTTSDQYLALHKGLPAIHTAYGWNVGTALTSHKEYAKGRKVDPDDIDMFQLRRDVISLQAGGVTSAPVAPAPVRPVPAPAPKPRRAPIPWGVIGRGDRGNKVVIVQLAAGSKADGIAGPNTERAIRAKQRQLGVSADGLWGPGTTGAYLATAGNIGRGDRGVPVRFVQAIGGVATDGIFGPNTERAVVEMQRWAGIDDDGIFGRNSRARLVR